MYKHFVNGNPFVPALQTQLDLDKGSKGWFTSRRNYRFASLPVLEITYPLKKASHTGL
jgi:hypothetical protein